MSNAWMQHKFPRSELSGPVLEGLACVVCGWDYLAYREGLVTVPVGVSGPWQVFACEQCAITAGLRPDLADPDGIGSVEITCAVCGWHGWPNDAPGHDCRPGQGGPEVMPAES